MLMQAGPTEEPVQARTLREHLASLHVLLVRFLEPVQEIDQHLAVSASKVVEELIDSRAKLHHRVFSEQRQDALHNLLNAILGEVGLPVVVLHDLLSAAGQTVLPQAKTHLLAGQVGQRQTAPHRDLADPLLDDHRIALAVEARHLWWNAQAVPALGIVDTLVAARDGSCRSNRCSSQARSGMGLRTATVSTTGRVSRVEILGVEPTGRVTPRKGAQRIIDLAQPAVLALHARSFERVIDATTSVAAHSWSRHLRASKSSVKGHHSVQR